MEANPTIWNVVVNGFWNRAIMTPAGIAKHLFDADGEVGIEVRVNFSGVEPHAVKYEEVTVQVSRDKIIVGAEEPNYVGLLKAMTATAKALSSLPDTPVLGAGINIRYTADRNDSELSKYVCQELDSLGSSGLLQLSSSATHSLKFGEGVVNLRTEHTEDDKLTVEFNFHLSSDDTEKLGEWISQDLKEIQTKVRDILSTAMGVDVDEEEIPQ